ncbi:MAG: PEP-CTERM system TPR-repeat protein PrsT [Nitrospirae bacterium]|nr:PEP-CTERM system TPR-repeat protein PrsT [Nitrospirota bacterium]
MSKRHFLVFLVLLLALGCAEKSREELLKEGIAYINDGNPRGAIVLLKNVLEKDKNFFEARFYLAKAYRLTGKFERAEKEFQKVLRQDPDYSDARLELARVYLYTERPDEGIEEVEGFLDKNPEVAEAYEVRGQLYLAREQVDDAEADFRKALALDPERIPARLYLARIYMRSGDGEEARRLLSEVIERDGKNTRAYYLLASLETSLNNRAGALEAYQKITEISPNDVNALFRAGLLHVDNRELKEAGETAVEILKRFPDRPEGYRLKGIVAFYRRDFKEAITALQKAANIQPDMRTYYFLGLGYYGNGDLEMSLNWFQKTVDLAPSFVQPRLMIAMILLKQGRVDESIAESRRILKMDDNMALAHNVLGSAYMVKGEYEAGMKEFDRAVEIDPELVDVYIKKGLFMISKGRFREAETELEASVKIAPDVLNTRLLLASYYMKQKEYGKAVETLRGGLGEKERKTDAVLYNYMASALMAQKKYGDALEYLQKAKDIEPRYFSPYFNIAGYYILKGDYDRAMDEYKAVLSKSPGNLKANLKMAALLEMRGRDDEALGYYRRARQTNTPGGFMALANYYIKKKEPAKAVEVLDEAVKAVKNNVPALEMKGRIYLYEKRFDDALRVFEAMEAVSPERAFPLIVNTYIAKRDYNEALKRMKERQKEHPDDPELMSEIARVYLLKGETSKAVEVANGLIERKPRSAYGYTVLAVVYMGMKKMDKALEALEKGLGIDSRNVKARMMQASIYARKGEHARAIGIYEDVIRDNPRYIRAIFAQGTLYDLMGRKEDSVRKYLQVLKIKENHVPSLNNLAYLYADGYGSREDALRFALKAYSIAPSNGSVMDTLGYVLLRNNRADDAVKVLEKAVALLPSNPTVRYHLALAYRASGRDGAARESLEKALAAERSFPEETRARKLLGKLLGEGGR